MRIVFILILTILLNDDIRAQKHDYVWHLSSGDYSNNPNDSIWGKSVIDFNVSLSGLKKHYNPYSYIDYLFANTCISDKSGNFLFTFNGDEIEDASNKTMQNGRNFDNFYSNRSIPQAGLILPIPDSDNLYSLFHMTLNFDEQGIGVYSDIVYYSVIDMNKNNGLGSVIEKKTIIIQDTLDAPKLSATKHANGKDWWIIIPGNDNNVFHRILLTKNGPVKLDNQYTEAVQRKGAGQAFFSNNGMNYIKFSAIGSSEGNFLYIYTFDRCSGNLNGPLTYHYQTINNEFGGIAISPSSQFLYLLAFDKIFQFDLNNEDVLGSRQLVAEKDDYLDFIPNSNFQVPHNFHVGLNAADGKIYISPYSSTRVLTTIEYPDLEGVACEVRQHSVKLPTVNTGLPNFPNYRLGPLEGSPCDTLGIVNLPLSRWRADQSEEDHLEFRMVDVSDYEPTEWHWAFGDGNTSEERHPTHSFSQNGTYEICLTVSNAHGSDTSCETFQVGSTSISEEELHIAVSVYPNPVQEDLFIDIRGYYPGEARVVLYDMQGKKVKEQRVYHGSNYVYVGNLAAGMYVYKVEDAGVEVKVGKVTKM